MRKAKQGELLVDVLLVYPSGDKPYAAVVYEDGTTGEAPLSELTFMKEQVTYSGSTDTIVGELMGFFQAGDSDGSEPTALIKTEDGQLREASAYRCKVEVVPCTLK